MENSRPWPGGGKLRLRVDPYAPLARILPLAERTQAPLLRGLRSDIANVLEEHGVATVLDVGCGRGALVAFLCRRGFSAVGVEPSPTMRGGARNRPGAFAAAAGETLPFGDRRFDAAVITMALHEMDGGMRSAVFGEMNRVTRPGGIVLVADFAEPARRTWAARFVAWLSHRDERAFGRIHLPHYANYLEFMARHGTESWLRAEGANVIDTRPHLAGNVVVAVCRVGG